nr:DNA-directed DNA polymerase [Tanacetum cinerariifolium]
MDAMTLKMDAQYKELQSNAKKAKPDLDEDDIPMSREEEAKFMQTFPFSCNALANLVASINLMAYSLYAKLSLETLKPTKMSVRLADRLFQYPVEIAENMLVEVVKSSIPSKEPTSKKEIFTEFDELLAMTADENSNSESDIEEPPFEKLTINTDYKIETSLEEPPTHLELKPLHDNLEYVLLEEPSFLPLLDDKKSIVQKQRRLNLNMQEVVKKEIVNLLDTGIINLIADSPWVSPIHCVPKKGGITVVTNENDVLVPTRTVTGCPWVSPIHCVPKKGGITVVTNENDELVPTRTVTGWKGTENAAADHLLRIENDELSDDSEVDDNFPGETLMEINTKDEPCIIMENSIIMENIIYHGE